MSLIEPADEPKAMASNINKTLTDYQVLLKEFSSGEALLTEEAEIYCSKHEALGDYFHLIL